DTLEKPTRLSRELGDVHPMGNPHVWLDPLNAASIAERIAETLVRLDPEHADTYRQRSDDFARRLDVALFGAALVEQVGRKKLRREARHGRLDRFLSQHELSDQLDGWSSRARAVAEHPIVTYHRTWSYFAARFGITVAETIEEKAGIPPSARHRDHVIEVVQREGVRVILQAAFQDRSYAEAISEVTHVRVASVPADIGSEVGVSDYFALIDRVFAALESERSRP
ncbi:MAG: zinc ABC transporter substrate-binding protein, partial [Planctomycetes bacterium]|nr:zinc ABC transporter substrate-binding protein [Planctomycetota bacterium]